ncbi:MAG: crossover junction endodeoxyribonuclease RuvC [Firmicutes bacterium]|jgi:crossover junction endodeoxyribonuclease RuvC|nr:crossover junction endodeoxyribonuclease RuvC [Bacillota bacterium]
MLVLGIDPGTATTGFGLVREQEGKFLCVHAGYISTEPDRPLVSRLCHIYDELSDIIEKDKPSCAAVEQLFFNTNAKSALAVGEARGVSLLACARAGLPVAEYTPLQVKLAVTGYGRADKNQMKAMVRLLLGLSDEPRPDDVADALAIAICHLTTSPYMEKVARDGGTR